VKNGHSTSGSGSSKKCQHAVAQQPLTVATAEMFRVRTRPTRRRRAAGAGGSRGGTRDPVGPGVSAAITTTGWFGELVRLSFTTAEECGRLPTNPDDTVESERPTRLPDTSFCATRGDDRQGVPPKECLRSACCSGFGLGCGFSENDIALGEPFPGFLSTKGLAKSRVGLWLVTIVGA